MATISKKEFKKAVSISIEVIVEKKRVVRFPRGENVNDLDLDLELTFRKRKDCYL